MNREVRKIVVRDAEGEVRKRRQEQFIGFVVLVVMAIVFGLLVWLAAISPPSNLPNAYFYMF